MAVATQHVDLIIEGGRVIDPESGLDDHVSVGITDGTITFVGEQPEAAQPEAVLDATGLIVAPGFIDMHSHAQTINGARLQALDGVTTALELEGGTLPVTAHYEYAEQTGRAINYGYSAGWAAIRMYVLDGAAAITPQQSSGFRLGLSMFEKYQDGPRWRGPATAAEEDEIVDVVRRQIADGAIGIGLLQGYVPGSELSELHKLARLGAEVGQPLFVHSRSMASEGPGDAREAVAELITAAEETGAHIHLCHMNSTSGYLADLIADDLGAAQQRGVHLTTESYPFTAGSTVIGAAFLDPDELPRNRLTPSSLIYLEGNERIADEQRLREIRASDPGGLCIIENFDLSNPDNVAMLMHSQTYPDAAIASDAMPLSYLGEGTDAQRRARTEDVWPLPDGMFTHPRSAGCFSNALSWLVRDLGALSLTEVVRRSTLVPATILQEAIPRMHAKGRLQEGCDADVTVFDPDTVRAGATFERLAPAEGFQHVIVGGTPVVRDGVLDPQAFAGRALHGSHGSPT